MENIILQLIELRRNLHSKVHECDKLRKSYEEQGEYLTARNYSLMKGAFEYSLDEVEKILKLNVAPSSEVEKSFYCQDGDNGHERCKFQCNGCYYA